MLSIVCRQPLSTAGLLPISPSHFYLVRPERPLRPTSYVRRPTSQVRAANNKPILDREALRDEGLMGAAVWHNAVGFLIFDTRAANEPHKPPGLGGCRIHPEQYAQAMKIAFDGMYEEGEEPEENEETKLEAVEKAMGMDAFKVEAAA